MRPPDVANAKASLLRVRDLSVAFQAAGADLLAVEGIGLDIDRGEVIGLVGESGCGKSVTSLAIMGLLPDNARATAGSIVFEGCDLLRFGEQEMARLRGRHISMIFQDPAAALNPAFRVVTQIGEVLRLHEGLTRAEARRRAVELLERVGISEPERRADAYPHELSGGMRQRVMIAIAIACKPQLLIADEPTTALDVTVQAQILQLLDDLRHDLGTAILLITHDLGVIAETADYVNVMYAGRIVEQGPVDRIFLRPAHPYTRALLRSIPDIDRPLAADRMLPAIPGAVPAIGDMPSGCRFRDRCRHAFAACAGEPPLIDLGEGHLSRCWLHDQ